MALDNITADELKIIPIQNIQSLINAASLEKRRLNLKAGPKLSRARRLEGKWHISHPVDGKRIVKGFNSSDTIKNSPLKQSMPMLSFSNVVDQIRTDHNEEEVISNVTDSNALADTLLSKINVFRDEHSLDATGMQDTYEELFLLNSEISDLSVKTRLLRDFIIRCEQEIADRAAGVSE